MPSVEFGRLLIFAAVLLAIAGILLVSGVRIPFFGRLPGDIQFPHRWRLRSPCSSAPR